jgi:c-di-GMP-related signal transduction protein
LFSLLDALLDRPLEDVLNEVGLAPEIDSVLRGQASADNVLDTIYRLVRSYEAGDWTQVEHLACRLGTPTELIGAAYCEALPWADEIANA